MFRIRVKVRISVMVRVSLNISCTFHYVPRDSKEQYNADCLARLGLALEGYG